MNKETTVKKDDELNKTEEVKTVEPEIVNAQNDDERNPFKNGSLNTRTPLDVKKALIMGASSIAFSAVPLVYERIKNTEGKFKKATKREVFDCVCYNLPAAIPLLQNLFQGNKIGTKIVLGLKFAPLVPFFLHISREGGIKNVQLDATLFTKLVPFAGNMVIPAITKDPTILTAITGLTATFGAPALYLMFGGKQSADGKATFGHKLMAAIPFMLAGLSSLSMLINRDKNTNQYNNGFQQANRSFGNYGSINNNQNSFLNNLGLLGMNVARTVGTFTGNGGNYYGGNPFAMLGNAFGLSGANSVYNGGTNTYWNGQRHPI